MSYTSVSLWNYYREEHSDPITDSESFEFMIIVTGITSNENNEKEVETDLLLKYLSNFWELLKFLWLTVK